MKNRKLYKILMLIIIMLVINGCTLHNKKAEKYVTFSYSDSVTSDYKCKIKDSKINCIVIEPENNELVFMGWYDEYDNKVDIEGDFQDSVVLHPKFLNEEDTKKEKLSAPKYTITFSLNGGSGNLDKIEIEYEGQLPKLNSVPTREGYIFVGFFDKPDYTKGKRYYDEKGESIRNFDKVNNTAMYAGWEKKKSEPSSSSAKPSSSTVKPSSSSARPSTATQKPSTSTMSPSTATVRPSTSSVKPSTSTMPPTRYKIAFDLNGGSGSVPYVEYVTYGSVMPSMGASSVSRTGYTFTGWYDSNGIQYYTSENKSARNYDKTGSTILYAGWKANTFTVVYNGNNSTSGSVSSHTCTYDAECTVKANGFTKNGYIFTGWKKSNAGNIVAATSSIKNTVASGTVTYYAQWTSATYKLSYSLNGGNGTAPGTINVTYGQTLSKLTTAAPTKTGHTFQGWYDKANYNGANQYYKADGTSTRNYDKYSDTTLYAGWKVNTYTVSFDLNGGTGTKPGNVSVTYNANMPKMAATTPTKDGYEFKGWYDNVDWSIGKLYYNPDGSSARPYDKTTNTTLYAGWKNKGVSINVATYNIGYFGCGTSSKVHCKATLAQITEMFNKYKIEMAGIQEAVPAHDVVKLGKNVGMNYYFKTVPANVNMILSKYEIKSKKATTLVSCHEKRSLDKVIVNINGVDISFYNTHYSYQSGCPAKQMEFVANIIKDDPNPVILTGDTNVTSIKYYETYLKPIGFEIAAYDGITHGYCDSVFIIPKGHIDVISAKTEEVYGIYSDHNFVVATLSIH